MKFKWARTVLAIGLGQIFLGGSEVVSSATLGLASTYGFGLPSVGFLMIIISGFMGDD